MSKNLNLEPEIKKIYDQITILKKDTGVTIAKISNDTGISKTAVNDVINHYKGKTSTIDCILKYLKGRFENDG